MTRQNTSNAICWKNIKGVLILFIFCSLLHCSLGSASNWWDYNCVLYLWIRRYLHRRTREQNRAVYHRSWRRVYTAKVTRHLWRVALVFFKIKTKQNCSTGWWSLCQHRSQGFSPPRWGRAEKTLAFSWSREFQTPRKIGCNNFF